MCVCAIELNYGTCPYLHIYYVYIRTYVQEISVCIHTYIVLLYLCMYVCTSSDNDSSSIIVCCTILLGILTCGTSALFWCLYKKCCGRKENYNVEGTFIQYIPTYLLIHLAVCMSPDFESRPSYMYVYMYVATMYSCVCMYVVSLAYIE